MPMAYKAGFTARSRTTTRSTAGAPRCPHVDAVPGRIQHRHAVQAHFGDADPMILHPANLNAVMQVVPLHAAKQ